MLFYAYSVMTKFQSNKNNKVYICKELLYIYIFVLVTTNYDSPSCKLFVCVYVCDWERKEMPYNNWLGESKLPTINYWICPT